MAALGSLQNWVGSTEDSHTLSHFPLPQIASPFIKTSYQGGIFIQSMILHWHIIVSQIHRSHCGSLSVYIPWVLTNA